MSSTTSNFQAACKHWRRYRKLSQLELALAADVSQRHVSWLETGRSRPSREMVFRLAEAMEVPLRGRNELLRAAGFADVYRETDLNDAEMAPIREALDRILGGHLPMPALVVDRRWNVLMTNAAADLLMTMLGDFSELPGSESHPNLAVVSLHPDGLRRFMKNWDQVAPSFVRRLRSEALTCGDPELQQYFEEIIALAGDIDDPDADKHGLLPVLPIELRLGDVELSLFSVISTIGTPQDITTDELRTEAFYPMDEQTAAFFRPN